MTNALEILAVCGRKKSSKNILSNNALWFNNYKVAVNFFLLSQVRDDQNLCCIFLSHRKIEV